MRLTPGQIRDVVGVPVETFRHWRAALTCLSSKSGHAPCFTTGDALGFAVIRHLVDNVGLRVGAVAGAGPALFELCNTVSWHVLEASYLLLDVGRAEVDCAFSLPPSPKSDAVVVVALRPIVGRLRVHLLPGEADPQAALPFPPVNVPQRRRR